MPQIVIVMGSDADLPVLEQAFAVLRSFPVTWEARVISAHRTPEAALEFARGARASGVQVIIAAAGKAAHLAGALAASTTLPVIGVPISAPGLGGLDAVPQDVLVFHGGTRQEDGHTVTAGGRVVGVTAIGAAMAEARTQAYAGVSAIHFEGAQWRTDIASGTDATREGEQT
jgi:hypothetical protein